jgi:hypothetical protein
MNGSTRIANDSHAAETIPTERRFREVAEASHARRTTSAVSPAMARPSGSMTLKATSSLASVEESKTGMVPPE